LELKNVSYVTVSNLVFSEATVGIFINTSNYCTVQGCKFLYNTINFNCEEGGAGTITVTRETNSSDTTNLPKCNKILNNYIITNGSSTASGTIKTIQEGQIVCEPAWMYYQSIYLGNSKKTDIEYNTIINPSGVGISYNHGYAYNNFVSNNIVDACKDCDSYYLNNPINKAGICVLYDDCNSCGPTTVSGNINDHNYITFSEDINYSNNDIYYSPNYSHSFVIRNDLKNYNPNFSNNYYSFANTSSDMYTIDPYWIH